MVRIEKQVSQEGYCRLRSAVTLIGFVLWDTV